MKRAHVDGEGSSSSEEEEPAERFAFADLFPELQDVVSDHMGQMERGALAVTSRRLHGSVRRQIQPYAGGQDALEELRLGWCRRGDRDRYTTFTPAASRHPGHGAAMLQHGNIDMFLSAMDLTSPDVFQCALETLVFNGMRPDEFRVWSMRPMCSVAVMQRVWPAFPPSAMVNLGNGPPYSLMRLCDARCRSFWPIFFGRQHGEDSALKTILLRVLMTLSTAWLAYDCLPTTEFFQFLLPVLSEREKHALFTAEPFLFGIMSTNMDGSLARFVLPYVTFTCDHFLTALAYNTRCTYVIDTNENRPVFLRLCLEQACRDKLDELRGHDDNYPYKKKGALGVVYLAESAHMAGRPLDKPSVDEILATALRDLSIAYDERSKIKKMLKHLLNWA